MTTYDRYDVAFERGEGPYLWDQSGRRFLDFGAGVAVTALGHCHPRLVEALSTQSRKLWHCSNLYRIPEQERLATRLTAVSFADAAFFCNSGAEAIEGAIKLARKRFYDRGSPERHRIVVCEGAFHGRTLAAIAAGSSEKHRIGFAPMPEGFDRVPFGDLAAVEAVIGPETAAILVEPIQGEGGVIPAPTGYLQGLRALADAEDLVLIFDEVQCGIGRTGRLFAHERVGVTPDVMAVAKGLGGGFPVGAVLAHASIAAAFTPGAHGSTFGGNPLAMAVANAVLDVVLSEGFLAHVESIGRTLAVELEDLPRRFPSVIASVRGCGLMLGLRCVVDNRAVIAAALRQGLLVIPASDNVVRLLPPLIIDDKHVAEAVEALDAAMAEIVEKAA